MAKYHKYAGVANANNQLAVGVWGNPVSNPCPTRYVKQPNLLAKLTNSGFAKGTKQGLQPGISKPFVESCYHYFDGIVPPSETSVIRNIDLKTQGSYKAFQLAVKAGKIVLKPRHVFKVTATRHPGIFLANDVVYPFVTREKSWVDIGISWAPHGAPYCSGPSTQSNLFQGIDGYPVDEPMTGLPAGFLSLKWDVLDATTEDFSLPPMDVVNEFMSELEGLLDAPYDSGLITKAVAEANSGTFDLLTELGELKETVGFIMGLLKSIIKLYIKARRAVKQLPKQPGKSLATIADEIASVWMQFRYAVMPITYSVDDALATIADITGEYQSFRSGASEKHKFTLSDGWSCSADLEIIDRVFIKYRMDLDVALAKMKTNPFATAWELVPLSFVIDWVLNIGDLLSALSTPSEVVDSGFQYSRQIRQTTVVLSHPKHTGNIELDVGYYSAKSFTPIDHFGLQFDLSMSWKRWLDAISLSWLLTRGQLKSK